MFLLDDSKSMTITEFFTHPNFNDSAKEILVNTNKSVDAVFSPPDATESHVNITFSSFENTSIYTLRDVTQQVRYRTLIDQELKRSDSYLQSILPPKLVPRVQNGENNISFSVQSASVLFLDVVEFTPWCGSVSPPIVMKTLSLMFAFLDEAINSFPTMTRIKCIGDCYMAAGEFLLNLINLLSMQLNAFSLV